MCLGISAVFARRRAGNVIYQSGRGFCHPAKLDIAWYINDAGVTKCFEVALEYAWKALKKEVENQGLEVYGPKDSIKLAANLNLIDNPELWITFINSRNLSIHDYLGVVDKMYFENIRIFISESEKVLKKLPVA